MTEVKIGKVVDYKALENAIREAAKDLGWKVSIKENFEKHYELGSVHEVQQYWNTDFNLKGFLLPAMQITVYKKDPIDNFYVNKYDGFASESKMKQYLSAVSKHLGN